MQEQLKKAEERMGRRYDHMVQEFAAIRAGRANPAVLDKVKVDYYGAPTPVNQMAAVSVTEARTLTIQPWDMSTLRSIEKAIQKSDIGINPSDDGRVIRLIFPELNEERRKQLVKDVKKKGEQAKVACRNIRRDGNDMLKKAKKAEDVSEDDIKDAEEELQKITDKFIKKVDDAVEAKTKELMTI